MKLLQAAAFLAFALIPFNAHTQTYPAPKQGEAEGAFHFAIGVAF